MAARRSTIVDLLLRTLPALQSLHSSLSDHGRSWPWSTIQHWSKAI